MRLIKESQAMTYIGEALFRLVDQANRIVKPAYIKKFLGCISGTLQELSFELFIVDLVISTKVVY